MLVTRFYLLFVYIRLTHEGWPIYPIYLYHWCEWHCLKPAVLFNTPSSEKLDKSELHASSSEIRKPVELLCLVQLFVNESGKHPWTDGFSWCHSEQWNVEMLMGKTAATICHVHDPHWNTVSVTFCTLIAVHPTIHTALSQVSFTYI